MAERLIELPTFESLQSRHRIRGTLVAESGLRVGAGKSFDAAATDSPVIRDGLGRIFIPGSSLKGVLRSGLEALLRGLGDPRLQACDVFEKEKRCTRDLEAKKEGRKEPDITEVLATVCVPCGLFGSALVAGRVFVADLPLHADAVGRTEIRDGVGIDRDRRTAKTSPAVKYDHEVVPPGTEFKLEILLENVGGEIALALVARTLALLDEGELRLGGLTSRGLGRVTLRDLSLERTDAKRLLAGSGYERLEYEATVQRGVATLLAALGKEAG